MNLEPPPSKRFILSVHHSCGGCGVCDYAVVDINADLAKRLLSYMKLIGDMGRRDMPYGFEPYKLILSGSPAYYYTGDSDAHHDDLEDDRTEIEEVIVYKDDIYFSARPKHSDCEIEAGMITKQELEELVMRLEPKQLELGLAEDPPKAKPRKVR